MAYSCKFICDSSKAKTARIILCSTTKPQRKNVGLGLWNSTSLISSANNWTIISIHFPINKKRAHGSVSSRFAGGYGSEFLAMWSKHANISGREEEVSHVLGQRLRMCKKLGHVGCYRPVRDQWEYPRTLAPLFPAKPCRPRGMTLAIFYPFSEFPT